VERVCTGDEASVEFELPRERIGDIVVIASKEYVLGSCPSNHDISLLDRPLRSHGGLSE
jgi:phosphonoacetate hydrolase